MKNEQWNSVHEVFNQMEKLCEQLVLTPEQGEEGENTAQAVAVPAYADNTILVQVRAEIRKQLDLLRARLTDQFNERDIYFVLFPIVAHFDELIQINYLKEKYMEWPLLQQELFQVDDAGELFFETLDDILRKPQTNPFIFEIYYLCLSNGFRGKYADNQLRINEYLKQLREKISIQDLDYFQADEEETGKIKPIGSPVLYYAAAVVAVLGAYFYLYTSANP
jgi:type IV/VI secretion system ImpK/VasF family protein